MTVLKERGEDGHFLKITPLYEPLRARKVKFLHLKSADSFTKCIIETQNVVKAMNKWPKNQHVLTIP